MTCKVPAETLKHNKATFQRIVDTIQSFGLSLVTIKLCVVQKSQGVANTDAQEAVDSFFVECARRSISQLEDLVLQDLQREAAS